MLRQTVEVIEGLDIVVFRHGSGHILREKLLHQAFLGVLEGVELVRLQPDHLIKGGEAVGDFLLLRRVGK